MHGNAFQWYSDYYAPYTGDAEDPHGPDVPDKPISRVARGGSWLSAPQYCRSANRLKYGADDWGNLLGFRCCMDVP
jgi:formylglycine-generating enzyme required for sulfatase activity